MSPQTVFVFIASIAMLNGIFSPYLIMALALSPVWFPEMLGANTSLLLYGSSLLVSTATLLIGGVPAAIYERLFGAEDSTVTSMLIWLLAVAIISLPALIQVFGTGA